MGKQMEENDYLGSITVRLAIKTIKKLDTKHGRGRRFRDRSETIRSLLAIGDKTDDLMQIYSDPKKKKEFQEKFFKMVENKKFNKSLESMTDEELGLVIFTAQNLRDKKVQQLLDTFKKAN